MILTLHITIGLLSLLAGAGAVASGQMKWQMVQVASFVGTLLTGALMALVSPHTLLHVCASGIVFTIISVGLFAWAKYLPASSRV